MSVVELPETALSLTGNKRAMRGAGAYAALFSPAVGADYGTTVSEGVRSVRDAGETAETRVVVLGAGYAGLTCFLELQAHLPRHCDLVLVNLDRYHWFTTELHTYVAGEEADAIRLPLARVVRPGRLVVGRVQRIDPAQRQVFLADGQSLTYDLLVFALGSEPEYYGLPGVAEHSLEVGSWEGARQLRARIHQLAASSGGSRPPGRVVVAGGGLTGVELTGELADQFPGRLQLTLVEAGPEIMPGFAPELVHTARQVLHQKGVEILTAQPIVEAEAHQISLKDGTTLPFDLLVWSAGVRGSAVLAESGFVTNRRGRAQVDPYLRAEGHPDVYVVGDSAAVINPLTSREVPPSGQVAVQMGRHAGRNILRRLRGRPQEAFVPRLRGAFASLGQREGVGQFGEEQFVGVPAMLLKEAIGARHVWESGGGLMPLIRRLMRAPRLALRRHPFYPPALPESRQVTQSPQT